MVSQIVEDALRRVTISDIKEQAHGPPTVTVLGAAEASASERKWIAADLCARSVVVRFNLASFETGRRPLMMVGEHLHS
jgi:hypothetical protein